MSKALGVALVAAGLTVPVFENVVKPVGEPLLVVWANGGAGGGNPLTFSLQVEQDTVTQATRGYTMMVKTQPNQTFFGFVTGATIVHQPTGGGTAHLTGVLTDGRTFTVDARDEEAGPVAAGAFNLTVTSGPAFGGPLASGVVRIVSALPAGPDFMNAPGFKYDYQIGLPISLADAANVGRSVPLPVLNAAAYGLTAPDGVELPNGALPGQFNTLPGIGDNVPQQVGDRLVFPQGVPTFPNDSATLLAN